MRDDQCCLKKSLYRGIIILVSIFFLGFSGKDDSIEVKTNKSVVETGEIFIYEIKVDGNFTSPEIILPEFKNFKIVSQNQSKSYSIKENKMHLVLNLTYYLFAENPGMFSIEKTVIKDEEKEFNGEAISIEVIGHPLEKKKKIIPYIEKGTEI